MVTAMAMATATKQRTSCKSTIRYYTVLFVVVVTQVVDTVLGHG